MSTSDITRFTLAVLKPLALATFLFLSVGAFFENVAIASHFRGGDMSATIDANGRVIVTVQTLWRKGGGPGTDFPLSGVTRTVLVGGIQARFEVLNSNSRAVLASSVSNPALAVNIVGTTVSTDLSDPNFDIRRQVFVVDLPALGIGQGSYILYWNDTARLDGINNASGAFSLECGIIYDETPRATPEITQRINTTVTKGFIYSENLNATGAAPLAYVFIVGAFAPRFGPNFNPPGITVSSSGQVEIPAANTATLNEDNLAGQPAGDYVFKVQITDSDGQYIEQDVLLDVTLMPVVIDIKPGSDPNSIECENPKGVIPVAVLSSPDFDATTIDPSTVTFGPNAAREIHGNGHMGDVDGDGDQDMLFHFNFGDTGIECNDTEATLKGQTTDGTFFGGTDAIRTVTRLAECELDDPAEHDYNQVRLLVGSDGRLALDGDHAAHGFFPRESCNQYIYAAGTMVGGLVGGTPVVAEATFASEYVPSEVGTTAESFRVFNSSFSEDRQNWPPEFSDSKGRPVIVSGAQNLVTQYHDAADGIEVRQRSLAYQDTKKRNALIFIWEITNTAASDWTDGYFGFWADHDIGAGDEGDDRGSIVNGMAIMWDNNFFVPGFSGQAAIMGVDFLETPNNAPIANFSLFGQGAGSQADLTTDPTRYAILSGVFPGIEVGAAAGDIRFLISAGPFDLPAGSRAVVAGAILFGRAPDGTTSLVVDPNPPFRPDPNDPVLAEVLNNQRQVQSFYDARLKGTGLPKSDFADVRNVTSDLPTEYALSQNFPNPFNPTTIITFDLPEETEVSLKVYNTLGEEILNLVEGHQPPGKYRVTLDASTFASGIYFYRIIAGDFVATRKMAVIK